MPKILHLDIETIPYKDITDEDLIPPKTMTKPETIAKWKAEEGMADTIKKHSVDLLLCRVLCIGISLDGAEPIDIFDEDEEKLFKTFNKWFEDNLAVPERHIVTYSGFNLKGFDYPIIALRMAKYNLPMKSYFSLSINKNTRFFDLMSIISGFRYGAYYSQDAVCSFMGIPGKQDVDGSKVYELYKKGEFKAIRDYCKEDVSKVVKIFNTFNT